MSEKKKRGSARAVPRAYGRLTRHEAGHGPEDAGAQGVVQGDREGAGQVALDGERRGGVAQVRDGAEGEARRARGRLRRPVGGLPAPGRVARCCNGCGRYRAIGCKRRPHVFYEARAAQLCADSVLVSSRRGIDADEPAAAEALALIRDGLGRGLSPEQLSARNGGPVDLSPSTIYRWVSAGYDGMTNMELRRKVGYRPRRHAPAARPRGTRPAGRMPRSSPSGRTRAAPGRWTPSRGPGGTPPACSRCCTAPAGSSSRCRWRRRPPGASRAPWRASGRSSAPTGRAACSAPCSPTTAPSSPTRARSPRSSARGGARRGCSTATPAQRPEGALRERNHVEIRKLLPKGRGLRFDRLAPADLALAMSHVNSEPRGALGFATPARAFRAMLGGDAAALLEAYGIEDVPIDELDLTPGLIERARRERRCPAVLA